MKLQKCTISLHPVVADLLPTLLAKLMTLDHWCYPIRTYKQYPNREGYLSYEQGLKCILYFRKTFNKKQLFKLNNAAIPTGVFLRFCNTLDNPCLVQNGHDPSYAVYLYSFEEIQKIVMEILVEVKDLLLTNKNIETIIKSI